MLQYIGFVLYVLFLAILVVLFALNTVRIGATMKANPRSVTLLFPLLINFITSNTLFRTISPFFTTILICAFIFFAVKRLENVRIFGLTGGTATGKSTLIKMISKNLKPLHVIDTQKILEDQLKKGKKGYNIVVSLFENKVEQFLDLETRQIQKQKFMDFLYEQNKNKLAFQSKVESCVLWPVLKMIIGNIISKRNLMIINVPLNYRWKFLQWICYPKVLVGSCEELQVQRAQKKWGCGQKQAKIRLASELVLTQRRSKVDICIENNKTEEELLSDFITKLMPYMNKNLNHYAHLDKK